MTLTPPEMVVSRTFHPKTNGIVQILPPLNSPKLKGVARRMVHRLLHPQNLDGIWIGQNQYRLPLAPLNEYPEPWC